MPAVACLTLLTAVLVTGCGQQQAATGQQASSTASSATAYASKPKLKRVGSFSSPTYLTAPTGDRRRVFIVQQDGKVMLIKDGRRLKTPFIDLTSKTKGEGEQGLLSIAFPPDYSSSRKFYVYYTAASDGSTRVVEHRRLKDNPDRASSKGRTLLKVAQPEANHNGGQLQFDRQGHLYIALGDGGGTGDEHGTVGNGQDTTKLLGKILKIDPKPSGKLPYTIPEGAPFAESKTARPEIHVYGLRNPWRFSLDPSNEALIIADVGQGSREEINYLTTEKAAGSNLGWRIYEGSQRFDADQEPVGDVTPPVHEYSHSNGRCSVTGGYIVTDKKLKTLLGRYLYGDFCSGEIRSIKLSSKAASGDQKTGLTVPQLTSFGQDGRGRVYALSQSGTVYRISP